MAVSVQSYSMFTPLQPPLHRSTTAHVIRTMRSEEPKNRKFAILFVYLLIAGHGTASAIDNLSKNRIIIEGTEVTSICDASARGIKTGLNNALWYVGQYIEYCCEKQSMEGPPCSSVTILPGIYPDLKLSRMKSGRRAKLPTAHDYDDLFDVGRLSEGIIRDHKCCVMSKKSWRRAISTRLLVLHRNHVVIKVPRIGRYGELRGKSINSMGSGPYLLAIYKNMQISNTISRHLSPRCIQEWRKFEYEGFQAVHMRVEKDFFPIHCSEYEKKFKPEVRWCFTPEEISRMIKNTAGALVYPHTVLLFASNRLHSETVHPVTSFRKIGVFATTPDDMHCLRGFSYTEQSAISLSIAISANTFIGTPRSTMSTGIVLQRQVSPFGYDRVSYYYGCGEGKYVKATAAMTYEIDNFNLSGAVKGCDYM